MAPIVQASEKSTNSIADFIEKNKILVSVVGGIAVGTAAYFIYSSLSESSSSTSSSADSGSKKSKKKKSKKKKSSSATNSESSKVSSIFESITNNEKKVPQLTDTIIADLSETEKDELALQLKEEGNVYFKKHDFETAAAYYSGSIKLAPKNEVYYSNRSACYANMKDYEKVVEDSTSALDIKRDYCKCLLRRANAYELLGRYSDAMFDLAAITIFGGYEERNIEPVLQRNLSALSEAILKEREANEKEEETANNLPPTSSISSFFGAFQKDVAIIDELKDAEEGSANALLREALEKIEESKAGSFEEAQKLISKSIEAYGSNINAESPDAKYLSIALEYSAAFKFLLSVGSDAMVDLDKALTLVPRSRVYVYKGLITADKGSYDEAQKYFDIAIAKDPESAEACYHKAQLFYLLSMLPEATKFFEQAKTLDPTNVYAFIQSACISYKLGQISEFTDQFTEAEKLFPDSAELRNYYGEILADQSKLKEAKEEFKKSLELQEKNGKITIGIIPLINEASIVSREGESGLKEAEELLTKACEIDPKSDIGKLSLAQIKLQKTEAQDAVKLFEEASHLARTREEKLQAISFAEASKTQIRVKEDPLLNSKIQELMSSIGATTAM